MLRRSVVLLAVIGCVAAAGVAGCGSSKRSSSAAARATTTTTRLAKTKFVIHAALAFGAFHHFIYEPAKAGDFNHPLSHKLTVAKAALAAVFADHELKLAANDAKRSKVLSTLFSPLRIAAVKVGALVSVIRAGHASASNITGINSSLASIESTASSNGQGFSDQVPSTSELAKGGTS